MTPLIDPVPVIEPTESPDESVQRQLQEPPVEPVTTQQSQSEPVTMQRRVQSGETLRLIALDLYGNREFWVYLYLENMKRIENPNLVPVGTMLTIPDSSSYPIDASDPRSVERAKKLGDEMLGK